MIVSVTITIEDVQAGMRDMAAELDSPCPYDLVLFVRQDSCPYIDVRDGVIHWIVLERGKELRHRTTGDLREALYWIALDATRSLASGWERERRHLFPEGRDSRIGWLAKQVELLNRLDAQWAERFRAGIPAQCPGVRLEDVDAHPLS